MLWDLYNKQPPRAFKANKIVSAFVFSPDQYWLANTGFGELNPIGRSQAKHDIWWKESRACIIYLIHENLDCLSHKYNAFFV